MNLARTPLLEGAKGQSVHPSVVGSTITGVSLCMRCIASKTGLTLAQIDDPVMALQRTVPVVLTFSPCDGCRRDTLLYRSE